MTLMARFRHRSPLFWALWLSVLVHAVLLTLHFEPELKKLKDQLPTLEVMLVNTKGARAPEKADALAQANLDRGGNTDEKRQMKSPLPTMRQLPSSQQPPTQINLQTPTASPQQDGTLTQEKQRVAQLEQEAQALLTQLKQGPILPTLQTLPLKQQASSAPSIHPQAEQPPMRDRVQTTRLQEMAELEAIIAKRQEAYESRPKRQFIGARTREYRFASYVEQWRQQVERVGNLNYPVAARTRKLHGQLQLTVSIRADGSIEEVKINRSSGIKLLDEAARHIVQMAAPYQPFPQAIRNDTDILSITRTWSFTQQDEMLTE